MDIADVHYDCRRDYIAQNKKISTLEAKLERAMDVIQDLYMNTSTDMPAALNDECSFYQRQLLGVIGRAARAHKELSE